MLLRTPDKTPEQLARVESCIKDVLLTLRTLVTDPLINKDEAQSDFVREQVVSLFPLHDLLPIMLSSSNYETNLAAIEMMISVFSWDEAIVRKILPSFEQPYEYLLLNFLKPYLLSF